jgi:predicted AAA+ superfamily ATPase
MPNELVPRGVTQRVLEALSDTPVVVVNGPRQAGKTTLVRSRPYAGRAEVVTLDDVATRQAAGYDPRAFLDRSIDTLVVDEAQLEPALFRAIKAEVDRDRRPGRFLLTGSSRLLSAPGMADALVGRVETLELWPLAEREWSRTRSPTFIDAAFDAPNALLREGTCRRDDVLERLLRGGFPEAARRAPSRRRAWFDSYVKTTVQGVVAELAALERLADLPRLLRLCGARTGTELNVSAVSSDLGIPARTMSGYLARLESAFLLRLVPAWSTNLSAKVVRRPKLFISDVGLAAHLQGTTTSSLARSGPTTIGPLLETLVATELIRQLSWAETPATVSHFRDRSGIEVDLVLEHPDGRIVGVEVKATSTPRAEDLRGLRFLAERLGERFAYGCVLTLSPEATPFGKHLATLPISALWDPLGRRP